MRTLTARFALGVTLLAVVCAFADSAQAGWGRRRGGGGDCGCGGMSYGSGYGYGYGGGYSPGTMVGYGSTMGYGYASSGCCGGSYYGGSMYSPGMMGGYGSSMYYPGGSYAYGQQMYYPGGTSGYGQPMYYGGLQQAGYAPGYGNPGLMPAGGVPGQMPGATAETRSVKISDSGFDPKELTVTPGTTVHWTNSSSKAFTVTSDKGDWDSGDIQPGRDFTATFTKPGTFDYHCKNHPDMKGTVVVK